MSVRRTKIVATLGPASNSPETLHALLESGVDVCRINCSHSTPESIRADISHVRRKAAELQKPVSILLDLQGPKIRTGPCDTPLKVDSGDLLTIVVAEVAGEGLRCGTTYAQLHHDVHVGARLFFADGTLSGHVERIDSELVPPEVHVRMDRGGHLGSRKGINLPGVEVSAASLTEKDIQDLEVGVAAGADYVAISFVRRSEDLLVLKEHLGRIGHAEIPIIAKIEKPEALENIQAILKESHGIMVARGDLGVEVPFEELPIHQKSLIRAANKAGVLVITATQMLDSMERHSRPTRAEATDVANAILDGTDAVMLSGETATGLFPTEAVTVMSDIAKAVEQSSFFRRPEESELPMTQETSQLLTRAACLEVAGADRDLIVFTWSGYSAIMASKYRTRGKVFALTPSPTVCDRLALVWGITPVQVPPVKSTNELIEIGEQVLLSRGLIEPGREVVVLAGASPVKGATNLMKIYRIRGG
ncbi:MAG: pyruvate kinase [Myxococcota bacterium]|nr:pyruvate kinase [Myxococcota bacterium]